MKDNAEDVKLAQKGSTEAFARLYSDVYKDMYHIALYSLRSSHDASDVVSDTVLDAFCSIKKLRDPSLFRSWIMKILSAKVKQKQKEYFAAGEELSDDGEFEAFKRKLIEEINDLHIEGMPRLDKLNALVGRYVNLAYRLPSGVDVKFLDDGTTYLGNQLEPEFGGDRCFGVLANMDFILISTYGCEGKDPELVLYKKR